MVSGLRFRVEEASKARELPITEAARVRRQWDVAIRGSGLVQVFRNKE